MDTTTTLQRWLDALESLDPEGIIDALAEQVEVTAEGRKVPMPDKEVWRPLFERALEACESIRIERERVVASGREAAVLARMHVKMKKDLDLAGERLSTAGSEFHLPAALFVTLDESGKIRRIDRVRDNLEVARQLKLSPDRIEALFLKFQQTAA